MFRSNILPPSSVLKIPCVKRNYLKEYIAVRCYMTTRIVEDRKGRMILSHWHTAMADSNSGKCMYINGFICFHLLSCVLWIDLYYVIQGVLSNIYEIKSYRNSYNFNKLRYISVDASVNIHIL